MWRARAPQPPRLNLRPDAEVPFEAFFLSAKHTFYSLPTLDVLESIYGTLPPVKDMAYFEADPYAAVFRYSQSRGDARLGAEIRLARF